MTTIIYRYEVDGETRYVGSSFDYEYERRKRRHLANLKSKRKINPDQVKFFVIEECKDDARFEREGFYIDFHRWYYGCELWNIADPRKMFPSNIRRGGHLSEETRTKMSIAKKGKKAGPSPLRGTKRAKPSPMKGGKRPDVTERLLGKKNPIHSARLKGRKMPHVTAALKGRKQSEDHIRNKAKSRTGKGSSTKGKPNFKLRGRKNPTASALRKGIPLSPEHRKRISQANRGKPNAKNAILNSLKRDIQEEYKSRNEECSWKQAGEILKHRSGLD